MCLLILNAGKINKRRRVFLFFSAKVMHYYVRIQNIHTLSNTIKMLNSVLVFPSIDPSAYVYGNCDE